ncbi:hypothetical protein CC86DRAFT_461270 [Ophiobolus disseminans]|uniref:C2H2-type domain-containing protein n=1 Tax=Ophiobolus disseminans TaxID=1469910 RepID=A0A6A6ZA94_9PLEO|nr:hypothetical protein CC86DRAFT_461270 [Ophiobolus disseminans]
MLFTPSAHAIHTIHAMQGNRGEREGIPAILTLYPAYSVLLCREHRCAVYGLDCHLKKHHHMPAPQRQELLALYEELPLLPLGEVAQPAPYSSPINALGPAQDAFLCCCTSGSSSSSSSSSNSAHCVKLTRWSSSAAASYKDYAAQLWQLVKVQTFFRKRRYVRYFIVQEEEQEEQQQGEQQQQGGQQQQGRQQQLGGQQQQGEQQGREQGREQGGQHESERQGGYQQRLALLSSPLGALKRKDSKAIDCIAAEASAKDRTGWFKRTQWDKHLQAYLDWKLLAAEAGSAGDGGGSRAGCT